MTAMKAVIVLSEALFLIMSAPLVSGLILKIKNDIRMRIGPDIFQPYYNFFKLLRKQEVISRNASWIFRVTPYIVLSCTVFVSLLIPVFIERGPAFYIGDFLLVIFIFSLSRFFMALAGLDTGSSFGGMGSSREMFISSLAEPAMLLAVFAVSLNAGAMNLGAVSAPHAIKLSTVIAGVSLLLITLAETSRIPVDNQETHLELTMIHEAMILEYSGRSLAMIELASHVKQIIFFSLLANILFPTLVPYSLGYSGLIFSAGAYALKITLISLIIAFIEISVAKMRLFRAVDFLGFSFMLSVAAVIVCILGL